MFIGGGVALGAGLSVVVFVPVGSGTGVPVMAGGVGPAQAALTGWAEDATANGAAYYPAWTRRVEHLPGAGEGKRRFGALVGVHFVLAQSVAAAAGREVVEWAAEPVAAEEPVECTLCSRRVLELTGQRERGELRLDQGRRIERLLVAQFRNRLVAPSAAMAGQL